MFRLSEERDVARIEELGREYYDKSDTLKTMQVDIKTFTDLWRKMAAVVCVVRENAEGVIDGFAYCSVSPNTMNLNKTQMEVLCLYTQTEGQDFFFALEDLAKKLNVDQITIGHRLEENEEVYRRLYRQKGYKETTIQYRKDLTDE